MSTPSSILLNLTWKIAAAEAERAQYEFIEPEHLIIGLCSLEKFADMDELRQLQLAEADVPLVKFQIDDLLVLFAKFGLDASALRRELRSNLKMGMINFATRKEKTIHRSDKSRWIFARADELARHSNTLPTTIFHLLATLLDEAGGFTAIWLHEKRVNTPQLKAAALLILAPAVEKDNGTIISQLISNEFEPPPGVSEKEFAEIHYRLVQIGVQSRGQALLERCLDEIVRMFPQADQSTILIIEKDGEPVVRTFWPLPNARVSFTLVRKAIESRKALHWIRDVAEVPKSLLDTTAALYAPILYGKQVVGVIHIGITSHGKDLFTESDLSRLSVAANTIGLAIQASADNQSKSPLYPWVFISYAHKDSEVVGRLTRDLRRKQIRVWIDELLPVGEEWRKQLTLAIERTDAVVVVLSPDSVSSEYVQEELETARLANKKIFPIHYKTCEIPADLASLQYVDIRTDYETGLYQLAQALNRLPLQVRVDSNKGNGKKQ